MDGEDDATRNLEAQARLYGEPLGALLKRYGRVLELTQGRIADLLGVSAPMLSQLANGRRVRFGNPATVQRLQAMDVVARQTEAGGLSVADAIERLERNRLSDVFTSTRSLDAVAGSTERVFASAGTPAEHLAAADLLAGTHPAIADMLRLHGAGVVPDRRPATA